MKKRVLTALILFLFVCGFTYTQSNDAQEAFIKATTAPSLGQKIQLLKEYLNKYKGMETEFEKYVYANLCILYSQSNSPNEAVEYGEQALAIGSLDDSTKSQVYITVATIYINQGKNLEKAKNYSMQVIQMARANMSKKSSATSPVQWKKFMGAGYYIHAQAQEKAKQLKGAVDSYIKSYNILKNPQIGKNLKKVGKSLYNFKFYKQAEDAFRLASAVLKDYESYSYYAKTLYKNGKKDKALAYFKKAYEKKKSGEIAYNIGIILAAKAKIDHAYSREAIQYLLEASFLSRSNSKKARALAESLFFNSRGSSEYNQIVKEISYRSKKLEELIEVYNDHIKGKKLEDLSEGEKRALEALRTDIEAEKEKLQKLEVQQNLIAKKFNTLLEDTKKRLGIK